jgi:hypothetical protein
VPEVAEPPVHGRTSVSSSQSAGVLFMGGAFLFQRIQYNTVQPVFLRCLYRVQWFSRIP